MSMGLDEQFGDLLDTLEPGCLLEPAQRLDAMPWPFCSDWRDARAESW